MNGGSIRHYNSNVNVYESMLRLLMILLLLLTLFGFRFHPKITFAAILGPNLPQPQQHVEDVEDNNPRLVPMPNRFIKVSNQQTISALIANIPRVTLAPQLTITNYQEDTAIREAILAHFAQWQTDVQTKISWYCASNLLNVYLDSPDVMQIQTATQGDSVLLTARILLGLWVNRRTNQQLSLDGSVAIHIDEILAWRGVQKHHRIAYPSSNKRFTDGYQWKQKQQVHHDIALLSHYHVCGQHRLSCQGEVLAIAVNAPYLSITQVIQQEKVVGYLVAPGNWISTYETYNNIFLSCIDRKIFQLNPRNDYLALRMAFYLVEYWRQHARAAKSHQPILMAHLLSASMISVDKANLTSRFAPRIESALQKLYAYNILGEPPVNLSSVDTTKAQWGNDWLASYWHLVPQKETTYFSSISNRNKK